MLAIRLPHDVEQRLADLAKKTGRSKTYYARQAIVTFMDHMEEQNLQPLNFSQKHPQDIQSLIQTIRDIRKDIVLGNEHSLKDMIEQGRR